MIYSEPFSFAYCLVLLAAAIVFYITRRSAKVDPLSFGNNWSDRPTWKYIKAAEIASGGLDGHLSDNGPHYPVEIVFNKRWFLRSLSDQEQTELVRGQWFNSVEIAHWAVDPTSFVHGWTSSWNAAPSATAAFTEKKVIQSLEPSRQFSALVNQAERNAENAFRILSVSSMAEAPAERSFPITEPIPNAPCDSLYRYQMSFNMKCLDGKKKGAVVVYNAVWKTEFEAIHDLAREMLKVVEISQGTNAPFAPCAVIKLGSVGEYKPLFHVRGWMTLDEYFESAVNDATQKMARLTPAKILATGAAY